MSNAVDFSDLAIDPRCGLPSFLSAPAPRTHAVQFYEEETFLFDTVGKFISAGLTAGDRLFVIATQPHAEGFLQLVDPDQLEQARDAGRITVLDARATLQQFMVGDMPDPDLFREFLAETMRGGSHDPSTRVRAYGEMVDLLTRDGNVRAAIRLEELWHDVLRDNPLSLLCGYLMDSFLGQGDSERLLDVFAVHSHVIPTERFVGLTNPDQARREIALLQQRGRMLASEVERRQKLERELDDALRDLGLVEKQFLASLQREQDARQQAESSDAFKERLVGILGHDLRNPLNTILTTVRMMALRKELAPESHARLERVVASSVRMQRMIEQLLDVSQARLPDGIQIRPGDVRDLVPLVKTIVGEVGASSPSRMIDLMASPCRARVDVERFEQVVWSLLSYTVAHSEDDSSIQVEVGPRDAMAVVALHSQGPPIDPALFDSFHLETGPELGTEGLALGLFLANRIVGAHGGKVEARSSKETGTTLEAILPLA